jgi:putative peptidoglycan lipid II flippase
LSDARAGDSRTLTGMPSGAPDPREAAPSADARRSASPRARTARGALLVAAGILLSRVFGLVRQRVLSHFLGTSLAADALNAAFRIPNFLQNLFGEGVLSASFIPVYARLLSRGEDEAARRVAGAVAAILGLLTAALVLLGMLATPWLIDVIAPGFEGEKRALTVRLVRIMFPGTGLLVMSAWCLGILNSHRRFFLSYAAPILWNSAIILALVLGGRGQQQLAVAAAWGAAIGSGLQFLVQLPTVMRLVPGMRLAFDTASEHVRLVFRNFGPVIVGRGVVQVGAFVDVILSSLLATGAVTALSNAQLLYMLPVSLFAMSVSAAELPAMSGAAGDEETRAAALRARLAAGLRRIAFFVVPSAVAFLALGDVVAGALFQTGRFVRSDTEWVWMILGGSAAGLLAITLGRLYSSTFYALHDTRTPVRFALLRVALGTALGYLLAVRLPPLLGLGARPGAAGITLAASVAGTVEYLLLRRSLGRRIGRTGLPARYLAALWGSAAAAAALAWGVRIALGPSRHPLLAALLVLAPYGLAYFAATTALRLPEAEAVTGRVLRRLRRGAGARDGAPGA